MTNCVCFISILKPLGNCAFIDMKFKWSSNVEIKKSVNQTTILVTLLLVTLLTGCGDITSTAFNDDSEVKVKTIVSTVPHDDAQSVAINSKIVTYFSESTDMSEIKISSFTVNGESESALVGTINVDKYSKSGSFKPNTLFAHAKKYTATIKTGTNEKIWSFTSSSQKDETAPKLTSYPSDGEIEFPVNRSIIANFDEPLDPSTVNSESLELKVGEKIVAGVVSYVKKSISFKPSSHFNENSQYQATLIAGITDLSGNAIISDIVWTFTTGINLAKGPDPVNLRTAGDFVILTKTGISKTGSAGTLIKGDIGVSPAPRTYITGFSDTLHANTTYATSDYVEGKIYAADMTPPTPAKMTAAISDMETAYTDAAGRKIPDFTELHAGEIGGKALSPGLYKWGTNVWIDTDVTLVGGEHDVWIFQVSGDVIQASATKVLLTGGAMAKNVFWQVAGGAGLSLDTTAHFEGVVLAHKAIIVKTGATVNGRLLGQTASTLDANEITEPVK
jgi:hypothetical protein